MKLFSMLAVAVLAGAMMAGCADKDSHPEPHGVYDFEAENVMYLHEITEHHMYWNNGQGQYGSEKQSPSYYAEYKLDHKKVYVMLTKEQFYGINAIYSDTETLRKYIAEHDIILIRRYNEYTLKYQR